MSTMTHEPLSRTDDKAGTFGLWPGIAGVYIEHRAAVVCQTCARDILGDDLFERLKSENPGYDHDKAEKLGNIAAVLSSEEWDCPGANCDHCGIELDVTVIHYDSVCGEHCPEN